MKKRAPLITILFCILMSVVRLQGMGLRATNSIKEAARTHVLWCRCVLKDDQIGVLKRGLSVTIDNQALRLVRWKVDARTHPVFLPSVNAYRRIYVGAFSVSLLFDRVFHTPEELEQQLSKTTITVAGIVLCKAAILQELELRPFVACVSLRAQEAEKTSLLTLTDTPQQAAPLVVWRSVNRLDDEFSWIEVITRAWAIVKQIMSGLKWWVLGIMSGVILLLAVLRRRYRWAHYLLPVQGLWLHEVIRGSMLCGLMVLLIYASSCLGRVVSLAGMSIVLLCGMFYMLVTQPSDQVFLGRLKRVIGFTMGIFVIPCALRAYLLYHGF